MSIVFNSLKDFKANEPVIESSGAVAVSDPSPCNAQVRSLSEVALLLLYLWMTKSVSSENRLLSILLLLLVQDWTRKQPIRDTSQNYVIFCFKIA